MATYHAIAATGRAILGILKAAAPAEGFGDMFFELYQPSDLLKAGQPQEGISLYLYRVSTNTTRRNFPPRVAPDGSRFRPSLPIDLHYLLIPWSLNPDKQQWLLAWSMRVLEDTPIIPASLLNHYGSGGDTFLPHESIELVCEPLALQEIVNIWDAFKPNLQLSVAYVARMLAIDSQVKMTEPPVAQTRALDFGKGAG